VSDPRGCEDEPERREHHALDRLRQFERERGLDKDEVVPAAEERSDDKEGDADDGGRGTEDEGRTA
jgi:hypothetical protein